MQAVLGVLGVDKHASHVPLSHVHVYVFEVQQWCKQGLLHVVNVSFGHGSTRRDAVTALAFREGTHTLLSGSLDRTVKLWSCDDRAYMETLFGHQAEVLGLDMLRAERAVSEGCSFVCIS